MDLASAIDKIITEHGSATILRDNLALIRDQAKILKNENGALKKRVAELEPLTASLASQLVSLKAERDALRKPERRTTSGTLVVDGILWSYTGDDDTGKWVRFDPLCPDCHTRLCVEDVSDILTLRPEDGRIRYYCDHDSCGKFDKKFRGTSHDREEKAIRHILKKHEE